MTIQGIVHVIEKTIQVTDSFKKRDLVVAYAENPQFVEYITFQAVQDRVSIFDNLSVGQQIEIDFNLRGRPWTNKDGKTSYFNSLVAWRVKPLSAPSTPPPNYDMPPVDINGADDDDLPF